MDRTDAAKHHEVTHRHPGGPFIRRQQRGTP